MRSWILASTSSLDRLFLQSGELIIARTVQRSGAHWDEQKDEPICCVHGEEHQVETTTTRVWAIGSTTQPTRDLYLKSEYKYQFSNSSNSHSWEGPINPLTDALASWEINSIMGEKYEAT
jgi:hypothetical protein